MSSECDQKNQKAGQVWRRKGSVCGYSRKEQAFVGMKCIEGGGEVYAKRTVGSLRLTG